MKAFKAVLLSGLLAAGLALAAFASTPGTITIWADDTRTPVFEAAGEAYTAATGIPVVVQEIPFEDIRSRLATAAPVGEGADIVIGAHDWVGELAADGLLEELELPAELAALFDETTLEAFSQFGPLYGIPYARGGIGIVYNKALIDEVPETWDGLLAFAREFTDPTIPRYGFAVQNPDAYHSFPFVSALGGYIFGFEEGVGLVPCDVGLDNEGAIAGMEYMAQLFEEGLLPAGLGWTEWTALFEEGRIAMVLTGPWVDTFVVAGGIDAGVAAIPLIEGERPRPLIDVQGIMVSAYSQNLALVEDFLFNYIISEDTMLALFLEDRRPPAFLPVAAMVEDDPWVAGFTAATEGGTPMPAIREMAAVWDSWQSAIELIGQLELTPEEALGQAADAIRETLGCE